VSREQKTSVMLGVWVLCPPQTCYLSVDMFRRVTNLQITTRNCVVVHNVRRLYTHRAVYQSCQRQLDFVVDGNTGARASQNVTDPKEFYADRQCCCSHSWEGWERIESV